MNVKSLNEKPVISPLQPLTYSILLNKNVKKGNVKLNLEELVKNFSLDIKWENNSVIHTSEPAFVSKSYFQVQNLENKKDEFSYSFPPKGPIESGFTCIYCEKSGPEYHKESCSRPFTSSLVLSKETPRFPGAVEGTSYSLIVKKSGQKKIASKRARSQVFTDNIELVYEYIDETRCIIRISKNGSINIVSAKYTDEDLPGLVLFKINKVPSSILQKPYVLETKHVYMVSSQFTLFPQKYNAKIIVQLHILNMNLWESPLVKKKVKGKNVFMIGSEYYIVQKYIYNSGEMYSRSNKITNPYILCTLIDHLDENIKYSVMMYLRGSVQIKASFTDKESVSETLDTHRVYTFLKKLLDYILRYSIDANYPILVEDTTQTPKKSKIQNTVDGRQPQVCHNRPGSYVGGGDFRPVPYSFYGMCPMEGYYNVPGGVKRPDGKYEPCCAKLKNSPTSDDYIGKYAETLLNGFKVHEPDTLSAVYIPGTKILEPRGFPGLRNMSKTQIIDFMEEAGYIRDQENIFTLNPNVVTEFQTFQVKSKKNTLTHSSFDRLASTSYIVTPVYTGTLPVMLFFDSTGKSYFIYNKEVSVSFIEPIPELKNTILEGYLYPFDDITFYPTDIHYKKGQKLDTDFYSKTSKVHRYSLLKSVVDIIKKTESKILVHTHFDLHIINGSKYYLENPSVTGLMFIPFGSSDTLLWNDTFYGDNLHVSLDVKKFEKNRWILSIEGKFIPVTLLQQGSQHDIELPVSFTKKFIKTENSIVLLKIHIKRTDFRIDQRKPFIPLEVLDQHINTYSEVIHILESINNPIPRTVFTELASPPGFILDHVLYSFQGIGEPLKMEKI
jgi:hypothetical protein